MKAPWCQVCQTPVDYWCKNGHSILNMAGRFGPIPSTPIHYPTGIKMALDGGRLEPTQGYVSFEASAAQCQLSYMRGVRAGAVVIMAMLLLLCAAFVFGCALYLVGHNFRFPFL